MHRMTHASFRLSRKNLGSLREISGQMVHRPPGQKLPVRLWLKAPPPPPPPTSLFLTLGKYSLKTVDTLILQPFQLD